MACLTLSKLFLIFNSSFLIEGRGHAQINEELKMRNEEFLL